MREVLHDPKEDQLDEVQRLQPNESCSKNFHQNNKR